jgi:hypothetical protein
MNPSHDHRPPLTLKRPPTRRVTSRALIVLLSGLFITSLAGLAGAQERLPYQPKSSSPLDLQLYSQLLETYTRSVPDLVGTRVDYAALKRSAGWKRLTAQVHAAQPSRLTRDQKVAFWINAYNILTIDLVTQNYPIDSIKDLGSFFSPVWDKTVATIEGREVSLGFIEHKILRKQREPRIHAAIVCASTSCPPLARTPFRSPRLDDDLDDAMRAWLASSEKGIAVDASNNRVQLSKIFDWFSEDFEAEGGALAVAARYVSAEDAAWLKSNGKNARIGFFDYDWSLNALTDR